MHWNNVCIRNIAARPMEITELTALNIFFYAFSCLEKENVLCRSEGASNML